MTIDVNKLFIHKILLQTKDFLKFRIMLINLMVFSSYFVQFVESQLDESELD